MPNYFKTRQKFGRWKFVIGIIVCYGLLIVFNFIIYTNIGFPYNEDQTQSMINGTYAFFSTIFLIMIIELVSNLNFTLIDSLIDKGIFVADKKTMQRKLKHYFWHNGAYYFAGAFYVINQVGILLSYFYGPLTIADVVGSFTTQVIFSILISELIFIVVMPILFIIYLPRLELQLDVFDSEYALGLTPVSSYLLKVSLLITAAGTVALYWTSQYMFEVSVLILVIVIVAPILYFTLPTVGLNQVMSNEKREALDHLNIKLKAEYEKLCNKSTSDMSLQGYDRTAEIIALIERIEKQQEWPFSFSGLRNLLTSFLLPIFVFLLNNWKELLEFL